MRKIIITSLLILVSIVATAQIKENLVRMNTWTTPFIEPYLVDQIIRVKTDSTIYALTHAVKVGQTMRMVIDSNWAKVIGRGGENFSGGTVTKVPAVGENITSTSPGDWLQKAFYPFVSATISLVSSHLYEVGTSNTVILNHSITANSETIFTSGRVDQLTPAVSSKLTWTGGGSKSVSVKFTPIQGVTDSLSKTFKSYQLVGNNGSPVTLQSSILTLSSGYPYLYGMSDHDLSSGVGLYAAMTSKVVKTCSSSTLAIFNCSTLKYAYFVFPATCTDLTSILDQNGFEQISAFTKYEVNITSNGLDNDWTDRKSVV